VAVVVELPKTTDFRVVRAVELVEDQQLKPEAQELLHKVTLEEILFLLMVPGQVVVVLVLLVVVELQGKTARVVMVSLPLLAVRQ
jgi:hypothetical protein